MKMISFFVFPSNGAPVEMKLTGENRSTRGKTSPSATLSTTNSTWTDPGSNPGLRSERPATNRLSHGTANLYSFKLWFPNTSLLIVSQHFIISFVLSSPSQATDMVTNLIQCNRTLYKSRATVAFNILEGNPQHKRLHILPADENGNRTSGNKSLRLYNVLATGTLITMQWPRFPLISIRFAHWYPNTRLNYN
jgi:hypothetical protein